MRRVYFQFPLCSLSFGDDRQQRVNTIIRYNCVEMGRRLWAKFSADVRHAHRRMTPLPTWCKQRPRNDVELQALLGANSLQVVPVDLSLTVAQHAALCAFVADFEQRHGRDAQVRIVTNWLWNAVSGREMPYVEMATLAAIYSKIGATKRPVRITRDEIWRRALGFKSRRVFTFETRDREPLIRPRQIRSAIERLHDRGCFARVTYARRETYYSHRMTAKQLSDGVFVRKVQREAARQEHRHANDALTQRVETERRRVAALG